VFESLGDLGGVTLLGHDSVQGRLVEGPSLSAASRLHKGGQVGLWNVETREPDDLWFFNGIPVVVLLVAVEEVLEPVHKVLH